MQRIENQMPSKQMQRGLILSRAEKYDIVFAFFLATTGMKSGHLAEKIHQGQKEIVTAILRKEA